MTLPPDAARVRIDKWLWAARFFKTRMLAAAAVKGGKVQVNGQRARPGRLLNNGDQLTIQRGSVTMVVSVRQLSERRGPAVIAQSLYQETDSSRQLRLQQQAAQQFIRLGTPRDEGRPNKKQRRELKHLRGR